MRTLNIPPLLGIFRRTRATIALFCLNIVVFTLSTARGGKIDPAILSAWGYSWHNFVSHPWRTVIVSSFLHLNMVHLLLNLVTLIIFVAPLEYVAGTATTLVVYAIAMVVGNPLATVIVNGSHLFTPISPDLLDVGASLGIFGCAGALAHRVRRARLRAFLLSITLLYGVLQGVVAGWIGLDHCVAVLVGLGTSVCLSALGRARRERPA